MKQRRQNAWPFTKTKAKAPVRRSALTLASAARQAKEAGYRGSFTFRDWLERKRLTDRSPQVVSRLGDAYRDGMDARDRHDRARQDAKDASREKKAAAVSARDAAKVKAAHESKRLTSIDEKALQAHYRKGGTFSEFLSQMNPAKFDRCVKEVKARGGAKNAYAVCKAALKGKRNPAQASAEAFEEFHGHPSGEIVTVKKKVHRHVHLAAAGQLEALRIRPVNKALAVRTLQGFGEECLLAFNEKKNQLFVEGGDQSLDRAELKRFGITHPHELETLGKLVGVDYFTTKSHLGTEGGEAVYDHHFRMTNQNGKHVIVKISRYPDVIYRVLDEQIEFSGGSYSIRAEGIDV